ncbi:MAG TPA: hypothetical protein VGA15_20810 [Bradyrhizobium sp.]
MSDTDRILDSAISPDQRLVPSTATRLQPNRGRGSQAAARISDPPLSEVSALIKRVEDILLAFVLLVAAAPLMLLVGIAIKHESRRSPRFDLSHRPENRDHPAADRAAVKCRRPPFCPSYGIW